jgi:cyclic pyranopterin phosphate synthase
MNLSHTDEHGHASMVDVSEKAATARTARASATVWLDEAAFRLVEANQIQKGDVLGVARIAGIQAAKQTHLLIPLCHALALSKVSLDFRFNETDFSLEITSFVKTTGQTGVEMEALTAASVAALTVYDMCKAVNKRIRIGDIRLLEKTGGKNGDFHAEM